MPGKIGSHAPQGGERPFAAATPAEPSDAGTTEHARPDVVSDRVESEPWRPRPDAVHGPTDPRVALTLPRASHETRASADPTDHAAFLRAADVLFEQARVDPSVGRARLAVWFDAIRQYRDAVEENGGDIALDAKLALVNAAVSTLFAYHKDESLYRIRDYWATPFETLSRGGDCEDFAIACYCLLKAMGVAPTSMRMTYAHLTTEPKGKQGHAVLVIFRPNREAVVIDHLRSKPTPASQRSDVQLLYALDEHGGAFSLRPDGSVAGRAPKEVVETLSAIRNWERVLERVGHDPLVRETERRLGAAAPGA